MKRLNLIPILLLTLMGIGFSSVKGVTPFMKIPLSPEDSIKVATLNDTTEIKGFIEKGGEGFIESDSIVLYGDSVDSVIIENIDYQPVRAALVLDDIYGKKEMDFSRGFIYGLHKIGMPDHSVALKLINGSIPADSLQLTLEGFQPDVIFTTLDNGCHPQLIEYAGEHSTKIVNVFDTRSDNYNNSPSMVQVLIPSQKFNASSAAYLSREFGNAELVMIGEPEENDALLKQLLQTWPGENQVSILRGDVATYKYSPDKQYVFYVTSSGQSDIKESLAAILKVATKNSNIDFKAIGRPSWVAISDLGKATAGLDVYIPAKCFFDVATSKESRWFIPEFKSLFGSSPIKSYPIYSIMGFDMAKYFMPQIYNEINNLGTDHWPETEELQINLVLTNDNWYSGQYNSGSFIVNYTPEGKIVKIPIKAD